MEDISRYQVHCRNSPCSRRGSAPEITKVLISYNSYMHGFRCLHDVCYRFLVKKCQEGKALKILCKIYKDEDRAKHQLAEIKSKAHYQKEPFIETVKYTLKWRNLQR